MANESVTISLKGFGDLASALKSIGSKAARKVGAKAMKAAARPVVDTAKSLAPVDTGRLEDSIMSAAANSKPEEQLVVKVGFRKGSPSMARRATFHEFGTSKMRPHPFLRPALDSRKEDALAIMGEEMWKGIAAEAAKAPKGKN